MSGANPGGGFVAVQPGDTARLRQTHPCGGRDWLVTRIGADIGLQCTTCGRKILVTRETFERRVTRVTPSAETIEGQPNAAL